MSIGNAADRIVAIPGLLVWVLIQVIEAYGQWAIRTWFPDVTKEA